MSDFTDQEQIDNLKAWWHDNGWTIIGGIVLGAAAIVAMNLWTSQRESAALAASTAYMALAQNLKDSNLDEARTESEALFREYAGSPYADQARLAMAWKYMDSGRDQDASQVLEPLAHEEGDDVMAELARLRLAKILLYQDKPQEVLDLLGTPGESAFAPGFNDLIGDAHYALGDLDAAAAAYRAVLADERSRQTVNVSFVRMKLDDLPAADAQASAADEVDQ